MEKSLDHLIKTHRYVFHVAHPACREGIMSWGLLAHGRKNSCIPKGVYAHNLNTQPNGDWYPFVYPFQVDLDLEGIVGNSIVRAYDYWRIDTCILKNDWLVDSAAREDFKPYLGYDPRHMYVYTPQDVPLRALTLFRFQQEKQWAIKGEKGTVHVMGIDEFRPYEG